MRLTSPSATTQYPRAATKRTGLDHRCPPPPGAGEVLLLSLLMDCLYLWFRLIGLSGLSGSQLACQQDMNKRPTQLFCQLANFAFAKNGPPERADMFLQLFGLLDTLPLVGSIQNIIIDEVF